MSATTTTTTRASLWDKHKDRTRRALHEAALELFARNGFDGTTVDMIVERAEVSPRTFFRYFANKDAVWLFGEREWMESFTETMSRQPESSSDLEAAKATLVDLSPGVSRHVLLLRERAVASSPTLRGLAQVQLQEDTDIIARAVASRRGVQHPDPVSTLLGEVSVLVYQRALRAWLSGGDDDAFGASVMNEFDLLSDLLRGLDAPPGPRKRPPSS